MPPQAIKRIFLTKWKLKLLDPSAKQHFAWRSWIYPYASTNGILQPINYRHNKSVDISILSGQYCLIFVAEPILLSYSKLYRYLSS